MMWREWLIRVEEDKEESKRVSLQAFIHPDVDNEARCLGFVSTYYNSPEFKGTCAIPPYGTGLFLNATQDQSRRSSQTWTIRSAGGEEGVFELIAPNKPDLCQRILAVEDCQYQPKLIFEDSDSAITSFMMHKAWKLVKRYDLLPKTSPPPPPSPPQVADSVLFSLRYGGLSASLFSQADKDLVCANIGQVQPGGTCQILSVLPGSAVVTGTVTYPSSQDAANLVWQLNSGSASTILAQGDWDSGANPSVVTEVAEVDTGSPSPTPSPSPALSGPCNTAQLSTTTDWALGCGPMECDIMCQDFARSCNVNGMRSVDSLTKGEYVLALFSITVIDGSYSTIYPTNPLIDYEGIDSPPYFWWNGANSTCQAGANESYGSRRLCCCGNNCPTSE